jgi:SAM-dependent methyltransferase
MPGKRVLDFGCGSGASTMALYRALPPCEIVGIELEEKLLRVARLRAQRLGADRVRMLRSPSPDSVPEGIGKFHYVMFSAVYEHLLPHERRSLLPLVWSLLEPGGVLFLNQTPYRYSPIDVHTTRLPLINYLPAPIALRYARRFSHCVTPQEDWPTLLRRGIRGATVKEIMRLLREHGEAQLLRPMTRVGDRIDLWFNTLSPRQRGVKRTIWAGLKAIKVVTGREVTPTLSLAIRKL